MFSEKDLAQINKRGVDISEIYRQIELFRKGVPYVNLAKPATIGDGILCFSDEEINNYIKTYDNYSTNHTVIKFVPASGAATRMFKDLYLFLDEKDLSKFSSVRQVLERIDEFAFADELKALLPDNQPYTIIHYLLNKEGLNYGNLPKAFIKFHRYADGSRTALEEHLVEGAMYATCQTNNVLIHFTISPEYIDLFNDLVRRELSNYEKKYGVKYHIGFSIQHPSTDTVAVDEENKPFRNQDGSILFRPAGHGALIHNLNNLNADLVFIKNIDNVVPDRLKSETVKYKKAIAGLLVKIQNKIFEFQKWIDNDCLDDTKVSEIKDFYKQYLHLELTDTSIQGLKYILFRPIRVCGMVKNEGEPGGGPFWIFDKNGNISLQIVESSQINLNDSDQNTKFKASTHFNPVDLVCSLKNYKGEKYNLLNYVDPETSFISVKTKDGKAVKALELPGLWNGAMAYWNTIFVEVPIITFNPVKIINDLLRPQHLNF